jgi:predicted HicB family RNase H-like nuclease
MPIQPKPRKPGRPTLPKGSAKAEMLRIRVAPATLRTIEAKAKGRKISVSEWIRSTLEATLNA